MQAAHQEEKNNDYSVGEWKAWLMTRVSDGKDNSPVRLVCIQHVLVKIQVFLLRGLAGAYILENTPPPPREGRNISQCHLGEKI
jgi:hypothetical protein